MIEIMQCVTNKEQTLFEELPARIHQGDKNFVPPFPGSIVKNFQKNHPINQAGKIVPFLAYQNGTPVGRIAAIYNYRHNRYYQDHTVFFGFFDSIEDQEVASALFSHVEKESKSLGYNMLQGPYNPDGLEAGLLIQGFEDPPMIMMPHNPPYYEKLYQTHRFEPTRDLYAYYMGTQIEVASRIHKIAERVRQNTQITLRVVDLSNLSKEIKIIQAIYNESFGKHWLNFYPLDIEELEFVANDLKMIVNPQMVLFAEKDKIPVGFSLVLPNINEFLMRTKNAPRWWRVLRLLWDLKTSSPAQVRLALLAVLPEYRNKGIGALFYEESLLRARKHGYTGGELSWVDETNEEMIRAIEVFGGKRYKSYRLYQKVISS